MYALIKWSDNDQLLMKKWESHPGLFRMNEFAKHWRTGFEKPCKYYKLLFANIKDMQENEVLQNLKLNKFNRVLYFTCDLQKQ